MFSNVRAGVRVMITVMVMITVTVMDRVIVITVRLPDNKGEEAVRTKQNPSICPTQISLL